MEGTPEDQLEASENERREVKGLRTALLSLRGVLAASVVADDGEEITRVSIVARSGEKSRRQVVQDVISLVMVYGGARLSPADVDVVFSSNDDLLQSAEGRPCLVSLESRSAAKGFTVRVVLSLEDRVVEGAVSTAEQRPGSRALLELGGRATLRASERLLEGGCRLHLEHVDVVSFAGERVVIAAVSLTPDIGSGVLVGAVRVRRDLLEASARAVLDAINRTFRF
ncbi:MAG: hypothetical protein R6U70_08085 [Bacillota bacterium]